MDIASLSVRRPVLAVVMSIIIVLFGVIGYTFLGVREFPSIDPPVISVRTSYTGANAEVIQSQITEPLEKAINGIEGIRAISAQSSQGTSNITVEFNLGANLEAAANDVRDKVSQAMRRLPQDIDAPPVVSKADANSDAILAMTLLSDTRSLLDVSDYAENVLAQQLQTIPGVSAVQIWGQRRYAMRIRLLPDRMSAYGLTPLDIRQALDKENVDLPSGKIAGRQTELTVNTIGRLTTVTEFEDMIVKESDNNIVRLRDVAVVEKGAENEETILKESGKPMVGLGLVPQPGANYIEISDEFYKRYEVLKKDLPKDYQINIALDTTRFIRKSISEVKETLLIALGLVILIIFLFFRDWLIAFRPLIDIPVSLIGAFFIMYIMGYSINVLTLLAIVLATGLVVDDGIVVTENIFKKIELGMSPREAAIAGTREIYTAVIITSLTLAAVFMPVIFLEGFVGRLFREFGIVIAGAVLISAFVSLTLTPMLNAKLVKKDPTKKSKFYLMTEPFFEGMDRWFRKNITSFLRGHTRWWSLGLLVLSVVMIVVFGMQLQSELSPLEDRNWLRIQAVGAEGTSYEATDALMDKIAQLVTDSVPEKQVMLTVTAPGFAGSGAVNSGFGRLALIDADKRVRSQKEIAQFLTKYLSQFSEGKVFVIQEQSISSGGGPRGGLPVQFVLQTQDFEQLRQKLPLFMDYVSKDPTFQGSDVNLKFNKPELEIEINREKARTLGVSIVDVAQTIQLALSGQRFGYYVSNGMQYEVIGQVNRANRDNPGDIKNLFIRNGAGEMIQLDNLITIKERSSPPQLYHYNRYQSATISAGLAPGKTIGDGIKAMEAIQRKVLDEHFTSSLTGSSRDYAESSSSIVFALILAVVLIYLLLAAQFENFGTPLIIIFTVPMAAAGALFSLWYFNQTLNIFSEIGIIMLVGLVTKNGILIIEFYDQLRERGRLVRRALIEASTARMRPILMTSLATMLGALPIALALGAGAESRKGMGIVIIGGLLLAMVLTLFVIPGMVALAFQIKVLFRRRIRRKRPVGVHIPRTAVLVFVLFSLVSPCVPAQDKLNLDEAIKLALQKNYGVLISKNQREIADLQNNLGNAGMSPTIAVAGNYSFSKLNSYQVFNNGTTQDRPAAQANGTGLSILGDWTIFDGMRMFAIKKRLDLSEEYSEIALKQQLENTVYDVIVAYHNVARVNALIRASKQNLALYEERRKIAEVRLEIGSDSKVDLLLSKSDENRAKAQILIYELELINTKVNLNTLLGRPVDTEFSADDTITVTYNPSIDELKKTASAANTSILMSRKNEEIIARTVTEARAANIPFITFNSSYVFSSNKSQAGFVSVSRQNGLNLGLSARWTIFNGGRNLNLVKERNILALNQRYLTEQTQLQVDGIVYVNYQSFLLNKKVVDWELVNLNDSREVQAISLERYKIGKAGLIETIETQKNLEDAQVRFINALYNAKVAETELLRVNGALVK